MEAAAAAPVPAEEINLLEHFRSAIEDAIIRSVQALLTSLAEDELELVRNSLPILCEYAGYAEFIQYKFNYMQDGKPFDTRLSACAPYGFVSGQRVHTPKGKGTVIGVAQNTLFFDVAFTDKSLEHGRFGVKTFKRQDFIDGGYCLLNEAVVNVWGQGWHSLSTRSTQASWWELPPYKVENYNPFNMPVQSSAAVAPLPAPAYDVSRWYWCSTASDYSKRESHLLRHKAYDEETSQKLDALLLGQSMMFTLPQSIAEREYLVVKYARSHGYQMNIENRFLRLIFKGDAVPIADPLGDQLNDADVDMIYKTDWKWYWERDSTTRRADDDAWVAYDADTCAVINTRTTPQFGVSMPFQVDSRNYKYELVRLSRCEGIQRNITLNRSRRILRQDRVEKLQNVTTENETPTLETNTETKPKTRGVRFAAVDGEDEKEEQKRDLEEEKELVIRHAPTSHVAAALDPHQAPDLDATEDWLFDAQKGKLVSIAAHSGHATRWKWTKFLVYSLEVFARGAALLDLFTDFRLLYKAQQDGVILLTITLFISIFSPYVLSYSSGIKLFIFRKTFDHLRGFKTLLLLLYLLPTGFLYFIAIDLIDLLFTIYKWLLYNLLCRKEHTIRETEEYLAQQLGMDRMNWEGFKRQKTVGQLMFETIPQVILQGLIAFNLLHITRTSISKTDLLISICTAAANSVGQIAKLWIESVAVHESFVQYALLCMMARVGWVPFRHEITKSLTKQNLLHSEKQQTEQHNSIEIKTAKEQEQEAASMIPEISFDIRYQLPCLPVNGVIEYDFSSVTIRYLIATLTILHVASNPDDARDGGGNKQSYSMIIRFGNSLRLLGVHDVALLLETCRKKNILLPDVATQIDWTHAFTISTYTERTDPRLISYSRDEYGRPLLVGLYLSGYDDEHRYILTQLLRNDVPVNLQDANGETIVYHLLRKIDYSALRILFRNKYDKDVSIYLNMYNKAGYSPLYLALHSHFAEIGQFDGVGAGGGEETPKDLKQEKLETEAGKMQIQLETATGSNAGTTKPLHAEVPSTSDIGGGGEHKQEETIEYSIEVTPSPRAGDAAADTTSGVEMAMVDAQPDKLKTSVSQPLIDSNDAGLADDESAKQDADEPLSLVENIRMKRFINMHKAGKPRDEIEAEMTESGLKNDISLLHRHIFQKQQKQKNRKAAKDKKAQPAMLQALNTQLQMSQLTKSKSEPQPPTQKKSGRSMDEKIKKLDIRQQEAARQQQAKSAIHVPAHNSEAGWKHTFIVAVDVGICPQTALNGLEFKLKEDLHHNLTLLFEHHAVIGCVHQAMQQVNSAIISNKCKYLEQYVKMATLQAQREQIEQKMDADKYLTPPQRQAFVAAYEVLAKTMHSPLTSASVQLQLSKDADIALRCKEKLQKKTRFEQSEIFRHIPQIMDAHALMAATDEKYGYAFAEFKQHNKQHKAVMDILRAFENTHCDVGKFKNALSLFLETQKLQIFAPSNGEWAKYIAEQQQQSLTLNECVNRIKQSELESIQEEIAEFNAKYLHTLYNKHDNSDDNVSEYSDDDDDDNDRDNDNRRDGSGRQFLYQILLSQGADPNFCTRSHGASPLAYVLINHFEQLYIANDLVSRGAILQAKECSIMVNAFMRSAMHDQGRRDADYLDVCQRICRKSEIDLLTCVNKKGNNPLHVTIIGQQYKKDVDGVEESAFIQRKLNALRLLHLRFPSWSQQKNHDGLYPLSLAIKIGDIDSALCLGAICSGTNYMKSLISHREFVNDLILWVTSVLLQCEDGKETRDALYLKRMSTVQLLFAVFEYRVSFTWPSQFQPVHEIVHFNDDKDAKLDLAAVSLIGYCHEKRLYSVLEFLMNEFGIRRFLSPAEQLCVQEMETEMSEFTGKMFVYSSKQFDEARQRRILDNLQYLQDDAVAPNPEGPSDDAAIVRATPTMYDDPGGGEQQKKAVSWIEVIYSSFVECLSTADFITDILILRDLWLSENLWWTTFMLSLLIAPYLVCYSALGSLIQHRMNFMFLTMHINKDAQRASCNCRWFAFNLLVLLLMTPVCIVYFVAIDLVFMVYVVFATTLFFLSCTRIDISDVLDDWLFKKLFGLNRMQIIGYRRLRTLSQLFFETIPQIFLQLRILWSLQTDVGNKFQIDINSIYLSVGFAFLHLVFEAAIVSLDSAASQMSFIHYAIVCLGARLDWIPFSHLFHKKTADIQAMIDEIGHTQQINVRCEYFESEETESVNGKNRSTSNATATTTVESLSSFRQSYNYEEISSGLCGLRYKLEFQFSNESMNKLAETVTYLTAPSLPSNTVSNVMLKLLYNSIVLEPLMMEIVIGNESCRNVDIFSIAELYRSTVNRVHLNMEQIDWHRIIHNTRIDHKYLSLILEEFINYAQLSVVEWLCGSRHVGLEKDAASIKAMIIFDALDGQNGLHVFQIMSMSSASSLTHASAMQIENKFSVLRKYYTHGLAFGLRCSLAQTIYQYVYQCLQKALQEDTYLDVAVFILWYTRCSVFHHQCAMGCCSLRSQLKSIHAQHSREQLNHGAAHRNNDMAQITSRLFERVPKTVQIARWEMSFKSVECFSVFKVHLEELLLNHARNASQSEPTFGGVPRTNTSRKAMIRTKTTVNVDIAQSAVPMTVDDEYTLNCLNVNCEQLCDQIEQTDIDLLQSIIDTDIEKLAQFPLCSFFERKFAVLDELVNELKMECDLNKYLWASMRYRIRETIKVGDNGKICGDLHWSGSTQRTPTVIWIPMTELKSLVGQLQCVTKLTFRFRNLQVALDENRAEQKENLNKDVGHIKLWYNHPIHASDKKRSRASSFSHYKQIDHPIEWNCVVLKDGAFSSAVVNESSFSVSIKKSLAMCMYTRRLIDHNKVQPLCLELSVNAGRNVHCDAIELEVEFCRPGLKQISITAEEKPIHKLCEANSMQLLKYVIPKFTQTRELDINALRKRSKETALHVVIGNNDVVNYDIVEMLLGNGINVNAKKADGDTALDLLHKIMKKSQSDVNYNVEKLLLKHSAEYNTQKPEMNVTDKRLDEYLKLLKLGIPIWGVIQHMKKRKVDKGLIQKVEKMQLQIEREQKQQKK